MADLQREDILTINQISFTKELLAKKSISAKLFLSSMDEVPVLNPSWREVEIVINHRKLSTYLNAIVQSGLNLEQVIESEPNIALAREQDFAPEKWYSIPGAKLVPTTFIVKAKKPASLKL